MINPRFQVIPREYALAPVIQPDRSIQWPWVLSRQERRAVEVASRPERPFDIEHYDRVLEERTIRAHKGVL